ncbi:hypothetical protein FEM48_Zijuj04G0122400 [Ziziphus jujuba var. spinosa]|uniref:ADP/ATP translocase n=1 Tax=Ziziphus jujuba var. spinosa TaxID=714518 RepID=A0A978VJT9_ZIZJJ|nr:hypothetical protein FEM48_Zijuj04G0122400 [Ziziphus jujuba var. spinosa]
MHEISQNSDNLQSTALVLLNTRRPREEYKQVEEMKNGDAKTNKAWGNRFAFLHVEIPKLSRVSNPLDFIFHSKREINMKRSPLAVFLNTKLWGVVDKLKGPEAAARFVYSTVRNAIMTISNVISPLEQLALGDYPLSGGAVGAFSLLFVYSLDYARTHLANEAKAAKKGGERQFNGLVDGSLPMNEIAKSFFKGASANVLHAVAGVAGAGVLIGYDNLQLIMFWKKYGSSGA